MSETAPLVSAIIPTMNRRQDLQETLTRLAEQSYRNYEVIVVDNGSTDGTAEMVMADFPATRLIRMPYNVGNIISRNILVKNARGKYVLCLDDDSFPGRKCLARMVEEFERDERLGLISFGVLDYGEHWARHGWQSLAEEESPAPRDSGSLTEHWIGCGGAFRKDLFEALGYWDEWGMEVMWERTLAVKLLDAGYHIKRFADIYVYHHWSRRGEPARFRLAGEASFTGCRSVALFYLKYYPVDLMLLNLWRLVFKSCHATLEQRRGLYLRALFSALRMAPQVLQERQILDRAVLARTRVPFNFKGK